MSEWNSGKRARVLMKLEEYKCRLGKKEYIWRSVGDVEGSCLQVPGVRRVVLLVLGLAGFCL